MLGLFYTDRHSGAVKQTEHGVVLKLFAKVLSIYLFIIVTDHLICRSFSLARVANMSSIYHIGFSGSPKRIRLKSILSLQLLTAAHYPLQGMAVHLETLRCFLMNYCSTVILDFCLVVPPQEHARLMVYGVE